MNRLTPYSLIVLCSFLVISISEAQTHDDVYFFLSDRVKAPDPKPRQPTSPTTDPATASQLNYPTAVVDAPRFANPDYVDGSGNMALQGDTYVPTYSYYDNNLNRNHQDVNDFGSSSNWYGNSMFYGGYGSGYGWRTGMNIMITVGNGGFYHPWHTDQYRWFYRPYGQFYDPWFDPFYDPFFGGYTYGFGGYCPSFYGPNQYLGGLYHINRPSSSRDVTSSKIRSYPRLNGHQGIDESRTGRYGQPRTGNTTTIPRGSRSVNRTPQRQQLSGNPDAKPGEVLRKSSTNDNFELSPSPISPSSTIDGVSTGQAQGQSVNTTRNGNTTVSPDATPDHGRALSPDNGTNVYVPQANSQTPSTSGNAILPPRNTDRSPTDTRSSRTSPSNSSRKSTNTPRSTPQTSRSSSSSSPSRTAPSRSSSRSTSPSRSSSSSSGSGRSYSPSRSSSASPSRSSPSRSSGSSGSSSSRSSGARRR